MNIASCYPIGYVSKTHGLKGELTVQLDQTVTVDVIENLESIFLEKNGRLIPYFVNGLSLNGNKAIIKLEDINTIEDANLLRGHTLYIPKSVRPKLSKGEFYDDEIVGFIMKETTAGILGTITGVEQSGQNRLIQIKNEAGREILIPANGPFIKSINKSQKTILVELPEGFLDI
jgi:16S rRNA processing protein RimM